MIHGHGGNIFALARELGCDPSEVLLEDAGSWLVEGPLKGVR